MDKIKIDIVSDVVCPWCIVGYKRLEQAIKALDIEDRIEIEWHPFEISPNLPKAGENLNTHITNKYGSTLDDFLKKKALLTAHGAQHDFVFNFTEDMKIYNTLELHILLDYAKQFKKQTALKLRLFSAYFTENKNMADPEILKQELLAVGLNATEALSKLNSPETHKHIKTQENYWINMGVSSVPTVIFNKTSAVAGAQPVDTFKSILNNILKNN